MPRVSTTYTVGVIREKEKGFLNDTDYTRLIEAPSSEEAVHVLVDTPYGIWMNSETKKNVFDALVSHLQEELTWLTDLLEKPSMTRFITARYNALSIVNAIHELKIGQENLSTVSPLSRLSRDTLHAALWNNQNWDQLPIEWSEWIKEARIDSQQPNWSISQLLAKAEDQVIKIMEENAKNDLAKDIVALQKVHMNLDRTIRKNLTDISLEINISKLIQDYNYLSKESIDLVKEGESAIDYEKEWDNELLALLKKYRLQSSGYDPIMAYWYAKEMEVRNLRILLSAKMSGSDSNTLHSLKRTSYTSL